MFQKVLLLVSVFLALVLTGSSALCAQAEDTAKSGTSTSIILDPVVVTASRTEESVREVTAGITVIDEQAIRRSTASNLQELMSQNGFYTIDQGPDSFLQIRGLSSPTMNNYGDANNSVLILLNGRRTGATNIKTIGLDNIQQVEIIRGPSAVQYGPAAMGGVVNIITIKGTENITAALELGLNSYNLHKEAFNFSGAKGGFDFAAGLTQSGHNDYHISGGDRYWGTAIKSDFTSNANLGYIFNEKHRLGLDLTYSQVERSGSNEYTWIDKTGQDATNDNTEYNYDNHNLAFTYDGGTSGDTFRWGASYGFGTDIKKADNFYYRSYRETDIQTVTAYAGYDKDLFSTVVGFDYVSYDFDQHDYEYAPNAKYKDIGAYLSSKLRLFENNVIVSAGGRYDSYKISAEANSGAYPPSPALPETLNNNFSPSVGLAVLPINWLKLRVNYAQGFKMPAPDAITGGGSGYAKYLTSPSLKPEHSNTLEFGADVSWNFLDASLTYFHTNYKDKIISQDIGVNTYQFQNISGALFEGLELSTSLDIAEVAGWNFGLRPYASLTYMMTRKNLDAVSVKTVGSDVMLNTPDFQIAYGLTFDYPAADLMANLNAVYSGQRLTRDVRLNSSTRNKYINFTSGTVVDMSIEKGLYDFNDYSKLKLRLELNNFFDSDNEIYLDYPGPGRNFYVGLRYECN